MCDLNRVNRLLSAGSDLVGYVRASRKGNTQEYMEGLAEHINNYQEVSGMEGRFEYDGKDSIVKRK